MTLPTPPQAFVDVAMPTQTGTTHVCTGATRSAQFVAALSSAVLGDIIELEAGAIFRLTTQTFTLANKTPAAHAGNPDNSEWIVIRSSAHASLPPEGTRVTSADASNMPKLVADADVYSCLITSPGAHHYRFVGIEMTNPANTYIQSLVRFGNNPQETVMADFPHHLVIDRCYIHKQADGSSITYGLNIHANACAVIDSEISNCVATDAAPNNQSSACQLNGFGPYLIRNNAMSAGCGILGGGGIVNVITNQIPSDITITDNRFFRDPAWHNTGFRVGNAGEWKKGQRILYEHNIFEQMTIGISTQIVNPLFVLIFAASNGDGVSGNVNPWDFVGDVTIRYNIFRHVPCGIGISRWIVLEPPYFPQVSRRFHIHDNLFYHMPGDAGGNGGHIVTLSTGPTDVTIEHNTADLHWSLLAFNDDPAYNADTLIVQNNLSSNDHNIVMGAGGAGDDTLYACALGFIFTRNCLYGAMPTTSGVTIGDFYDTDVLNWFGEAGGLSPVASTRATVQFVNPWTSGGDAGIDYALQPTSPWVDQATDGADVGVRWDLFAGDVAPVRSHAVFVLI